MPRYQVLFCDAAGFGVLPMDAMDPDHAADIVRAQYPDARLAVILTELLDGQDLQQLLADWLRTTDQGTSS